jgi:peptidoglycan/LPS O-acetylase OafA/YrhL
VVSFAWAAVGNIVLDPGSGHLITWLEQTPFFLPAFALGIFTATRWSSNKEDPNARLLVIAGVLSYILYTPLAAYIAVQTDHVATPVTELMMAPAASAVVLGVARGGAPILEHPILRFLGGISFSLYLWHFPVLRIVPVPDAIAHSLALRLPYTLAIAIPVALVSYLCVERPFLKLRPTMTSMTR